MPFLGHRDDTFGSEILASNGEHRPHGAKPYVHACVCPAPPNDTSTVSYMSKMLDAAEIICNHIAQSAGQIQQVKGAFSWLKATHPSSSRTTSPAEGTPAQALRPGLRG